MSLRSDNLYVLKGFCLGGPFFSVLLHIINFADLLPIIQPVHHIAVVCRMVGHQGLAPL